MNWNRSHPVWLLGLTALLAGGCTVATAGGPPPGDYGYGGGYPGGHGGYYGPAHIPPGHLPPPGSCRVWYPDRPPGHQPPPGPCGVHVPLGAWLMTGPSHQGGYVHVDFYDHVRAGVVLGAAVYEAATGHRIERGRPDRGRGRAGKTRPH